MLPLRKPDDHQTYREMLTQNLRESGRMAALKTMVGLSKAETEAIVGLKPVPALVVMGSRDPDFRDARAEANWLANKLGTQSVIVEGGGHYPHVETPQQIAPAVIAFLEQHRGGILNVTAPTQSVPFQ
ncbi:MAG TPA: alpha/beta hydrolase [Gallionella sp.]|nr:alpha/beta hydrolase [Gallionella sp.]